MLHLFLGHQSIVSKAMLSSGKIQQEAVALAHSSKATASDFLLFWFNVCNKSPFPGNHICDNALQLSE